MKRNKTCLCAAAAIFVLFTQSALCGIYGGGTGSAENPFVISTAEHLQEIGTNIDDYDKHFILTSDINLSAYTGQQFNVIGKYPNPFTGVFEGNNHVVRNLSIDAIDQNGRYFGLFGTMKQATVTNLILNDVKISLDLLEGCVGSLAGHSSESTITNCHVTGNSFVNRIDNENGEKGLYVGGMFGGTFGNVSDCSVNCDVTGLYATGVFAGSNGRNVSNCSSQGTAKGTNRVGGFVGINYDSGFITGCRSSSHVISSKGSSGGIAGINDGGTIKNSCFTGTIVGISMTGGLVGWNDSGVVEKCYATSNVTGSNKVGGLVGEHKSGTILECFALGNVKGTSEYVGGLIGYTYYGTISNCYAAGDVIGDSMVGGFIGGTEQGRVRHCLALGKVFGNEYAKGFAYSVYSVGSFGSLEDCLWNKEINQALVVQNDQGASLNYGFTESELKTVAPYIDNGWDFVGEETNGTDDLWNMPECGYPVLAWQSYASLPEVTGLSQSQALELLQSESVAVSIHQIHSQIISVGHVVSQEPESGCEAAVVTLYVSDGFPYQAGEGTSDEPYEIWMPAQLNMIANYPGDLNKYFILMADLDMSDYSGTSYNIIGDNVSRFNGWFDGNDNIIRNLSIATDGIYDSYLGLFASIDSSAVIRDLGMENVIIQGGIYSDFAGALAGRNEGTIANCYATGSVSGHEQVGGLVGSSWFGTVSNCETSGTVNGENYVGGMIGINAKGAISGCTSSCTVTGEERIGGLVGNNSGQLTNCHTSGNINGLKSVGGLVGNSGSVMAEVSWITNCSASGNVTGTGRVGGLIGLNTDCPLLGCYAVGEVSGTGTLGGLIGENSRSDTITYCYAKGNVSGQERVGGLIGYNRRSTSIISCYACGSVTGDSNVGGFVGEHESSGDYITSFWDSEINSGVTGVGSMNDPEGVISRTTDQMHLQSTFTGVGWDFIGEIGNGTEDTWHMPGCDYPIYTWQGLVIIVPDMTGLPEVQAEDILSNLGYVIEKKIEKSSTVSKDHVISQEYYTECDTTTVTLTVCDGHPYYDSGTGTEDDPFQIWTSEQMNEIGKNSSDWESCFVLMSDIDISSFDGQSYNIIGTYDTPFAGVFDGNGHVVSSLTYNSSSKKYTGLFGYVGDDGLIKDIGLTDITIASGDYTGGLVGKNFGTITGCFVAGSIEGKSAVGGLTGDNGGAIVNCFSTCNVTAQEYIGCLTGANSGTIINSYTTGVVSGEAMTGSLAGRDSGGSYTSCFWNIEINTELTGIGNIEDPDGIVGKTSLEMQSQMTFTDEAWDFVGESVNGDEDSWAMPQCGWPGLSWQHFVGVPDVTGQTKADAIAALAFAGNVICAITVYSDTVPTEQVISQEPSAGCEAAVVMIIVSQKFPYETGTGTQNNPFQIWTAEQMNEIGLWPGDWDNHFVLMDDIDLSAYPQNTFNLIGNETKKFTGIFDGTGHEISYFTYVSAQENYVGLFRHIGAAGQIKNLGLVYVNIDDDTKDYIGALAGHCQGNIDNCYVSGSVNGQNHVGGLIGYYDGQGVTNCLTKSVVYGQDRVGGLIGEVSLGMIKGCYADSTVVGNDYIGGLVGRSYGTLANCFADCGVRGGGRVGGLAGGSGGTINNSYAIGIAQGDEEIGGLAGANAGNITKSYAVNSVIGNNNLGCLVGFDYNGSYSSNFWNNGINESLRGISNVDNPSGVIERNPTEMQIQSTFTNEGWDFSNETINGSADIWRLCVDGSDYPRLTWEYNRIGDFLCPDGVASEDLSYLAELWLTTGSKTDINGDGVTNLFDYYILAKYWLE